MSDKKRFGVFLKGLRLEAGLSLRDFAGQAQYDVSNLSKIERGMLPPPVGILTLRKWLQILGVKASSSDYGLFIDLAAVDRTQVPETISKDDVSQYLPAFYRTIRNKRNDEQTYEELIKLLKKS